MHGLLETGSFSDENPVYPLLGRRVADDHTDERDMVVSRGKKLEHNSHFLITR